ncbi:MAG: hypothetical protein H0V67_10875 [Geodermatophilaceae bacterium]|nr:hypothetical protein [Geodermatophilaceae bacterium]
MNGVPARKLAAAATVVFLGLVLGGLGFVVSLLYDAGMPIAVCMVGGVVLCAAGTALSRLPVEDAGDLAPDSEPGAEQRSSFGDLHTLQSRFVGAVGDTERFEDRVRRPLAELAAERLRQLHRVDHRAQPERAQQLVHPVVWELLTAPRGAFPASRAQTEAWTEAIEKLRG